MTGDEFLARLARKQADKARLDGVARRMVRNALAKRARERGELPTELLAAIAAASARHPEATVSTDQEHARVTERRTREGHSSRAYEVRGQDRPERVAKMAGLRKLAELSGVQVQEATNLPEGWVLAVPRGTNPDDSEPPAGGFAYIHESSPNFPGRQR